jgi:hypothetical protein
MLGVVHHLQRGGSMRTLCMVLVVGTLVGCDDGGGVRYVGVNDDPAPFDTSTPTTTSGAGICDSRSNLSQCTAYTGSDWDPGSASVACVGDYIGSGPCPGEAVSSCRFSVGLPQEVVIYYYPPGYADDDLGTLENDCAFAGGVFTEL